MAEQSFTLTSAAFEHGSPIPRMYSCDGKNVSPPLEWMHAPPDTKSFALIVDDPDAPGKTFTHWVLFDLPASISSLDEADKKSGRSGQNDFQGTGYGGPCPPPNHGSHRYFFKLYALDVETLGLEAGASKDAVQKAMDDHVLAEAELMGQFERGPGGG